MSSTSKLSRLCRPRILGLRARGTIYHACRCPTSSSIRHAGLIRSWSSVHDIESDINYMDMASPDSHPQATSLAWPCLTVVGFTFFDVLPRFQGAKANLAIARSRGFKLAYKKKHTSKAKPDGACWKTPHEKKKQTNKRTFHLNGSKDMDVEPHRRQCLFGSIDCTWQLWYAKSLREVWLTFATQWCYDNLSSPPEFAVDKDDRVKLESLFSSSSCVCWLWSYYLVWRWLCFIRLQKSWPTFETSSREPNQTWS